MAFGSASNTKHLGKLDAVKKFAYNEKTHANIVKKTRTQNWYSEDLFARFQVLSDTGSVIVKPSQ